MNITIRPYATKDFPAMVNIWNEVVDEGTAFPQLELLTPITGQEFFAGQTYTAVADNICSDWPRSGIAGRLFFRRRRAPYLIFRRGIGS